MSERKIPTAVKAIIVIELFIAFLGLITGASLVTDPSGRGIGIDVLKDKIPFQSLFLLGLWFLGPYGVLPASLAYGFIKGMRARILGLETSSIFSDS